MKKKEQEAFAEKESNYGKVYKVAGPCNSFFFKKKMSYSFCF